MTSEVNLLDDKTVGDLYDYLTAAVSSGEISASLSDHLRTAVKKIFVTTCRPDEFWQSVLLTSVDLPARIATLRANSASTCSEQTIHVYQTRYERSVRLYLEHLQREYTATPLSTVAPPVTITASPDAYLLATQKILQASLSFQQEVLAALALLTPKKGGPSAMPPPDTK